jgi:hypothetical protein
MAIDLESNFAASSEVVESTVKKNGQPYDERMRVVIAKAALSKARRDATFQVVPRALAKPVETEVRKLLLGDSKTLGRRREAVMSWINKLGIDVKRVWGALGINGEGDLGIDQLEQLTGLRTAIRDNEVTIDEAFPDPKATTGKNIGDVLGKATDKPADQKPAETPPVAAKQYTAEERQAILKEVEDLMLTHEVGESRIMKYVHEKKLAKEGQDEVGTLSTEVLDGLRAVIPSLKKK